MHSHAKEHLVVVSSIEDNVVVRTCWVSSASP